MAKTHREKLTPEEYVRTRALEMRRRGQKVDALLSADWEHFKLEQEKKKHKGQAQPLGTLGLHLPMIEEVAI